MAWCTHAYNNTLDLFIFVLCSDMLLRIRQRREHIDDYASPLLVHCAAGVGRTGTFIVIDHVIDAIEQHHKVDLNDIIGCIRQDRMVG